MATESQDNPWLPNNGPLTDSATDTTSSGTETLGFDDNFHLEDVSPRGPGQGSAAAEPLPDSQEYLQSLEKKLAKLKGRSKKETTCKEMVKSLGSVRDDVMMRFIEDANHTTGDSNFVSEDVISQNNVYSYLERRVFPERQALTAEELQRLLQEDLLAAIFASNNSAQDLDASDSQDLPDNLPTADKEANS